MAKTVKQLADELGVSKQAIHKKMAKLPAGLVTTGANRTTFINAEGEEIIKSSIKNCVSKEKTSKEFLEHQIEIYKSQVYFFKEQLEHQNQHIKFLYDFISKQQIMMAKMTDKNFEGFEQFDWNTLPK